MRIFTVFAVVLALCAVSASAADVSGKWKATYTTPDGQQRESTLDLKAEGAKLTGTISSARGEAKIDNGAIDGDQVSFTVTRNFNGNDVTLKYKGKVSGDELKLTVQFGDDRTFEMTAKRMPS